MPQICYIRLLGVEYRSLRYIWPHQDLSPDIRSETPSVKSSVIYLASAIQLLHIETHPSLRGIESCWVSYSPRYRGRMFTFHRTDMIFHPLFPAPSSYFISLPLGICFRDHHTLFIFHYQIWESIPLWWNF